MNVSDKYLLDLLREIVSIRAGGRCEFPMCSETDCSPHHWHRKKNLAIRYDPDACIYLCCGHHTGLLFSAHKSPYAFKKYIIMHGVRTEEWADQVLFKANQIITIPTVIYRQEWKIRLLAEREKLAA